MSINTQPKPTELHAAIKLGIDARAKWFYVARQLDGATPQPVRKMTFDGLLRFGLLEFPFTSPSAPNFVRGA